MNDKPDLYIAVGVHWYTHPRFVAVQRGTAYGLYWAMTAWARDNLTDGIVPDAVITHVLAGPVKADAQKDRAELIRVGLLYERKDLDGVELHRFLGWNDSAEKVERRKRAARTAAEQRWHGDSHANGSAAAMPDASDTHTTVKRESKSESESQDGRTTRAPRSSSKNSERARRAS